MGCRMRKKPKKRYKTATVGFLGYWLQKLLAGFQDASAHQNRAEVGQARIQVSEKQNGKKGAKDFPLGRVQGEIFILVHS